MKKLHSLDEAFEYTAELISGIVEFDDVEFVGESYCYAIQVKGETWSKYIDIRHAKYINALQDTYNDILADIVFQKEIIEPRVTLYISDGCSNIEHNIKDVILKAISKMNDKQIFIATMTAIACAAGCFMLSSYITSNNNAKVEISKNEVEAKRLEVFRTIHQNSVKSNVQIATAERPIRTLIGVMSDNDSISVNNEVTFIQKEDIRKNLQIIKRSSSRVACCDGDYLLQRIEYSLGEKILYISSDNIQIKVYTSFLDDEGKKKLSEEIDEKESNGVMPFSISIQLNVEYTDKRIKHGAVVGVGEPRPEKEQKKLRELVQQ